MNTKADQVVEIYRRHALAWARQRGSMLLERKWLDKFLGLLPTAPSILDVGCGSGAPIDQYLLDRGSVVTGIDASPELIKIAKEHAPNANWVVSDMRSLKLDMMYQGILAWDSMFHLPPNDQRQMFSVFRCHAENGAALIFTSGPKEGEVIGQFKGEPLYHASLNAAEYRDLLGKQGFDVVDHVVADPECGQHTVWLARLDQA